MINEQVNWPAFLGKIKNQKDSVNCIQILCVKGLMHFSLIGTRNYTVDDELENEKTEGISSNFCK